MTEIPGFMIRALSEPQAWLWILYVLIPGWALLPVFGRLLPGSRASWYFMARVAGLGVLAFIPWLLSHDARATGVEARGIMGHLANGPGILLFDRAAVAWTMALIVAAGALSWWRLGRQTLRVMQSSIKILVVGEAVFLFAFAFGGALRMISHGIVGQEKFMDMAFLRSCIDSTIMPPFDSWLHHLPVNYYYGGYAIMAAPAKLFSTPPEIAYNLALALIFALTASMVYALGMEIMGRIRWALLTLFTVLFAGNLEPILQLLRHVRNLPHTDPFAFDWWSPSRVMHDRLPDAAPAAMINEFPFFANFHGDLHPHLLAMPFTLLFAGFALHLFKTMVQTSRAFSGSLCGVLARFAFMAWSLGLLVWINPFDFAGWSGLLAIMLVIGRVRRRHWPQWPRPLIRAAGLWIGMILAAMIAVLPFLANYNFPAGRQDGFVIGFSEFRSNVLEFSFVWGIPLAIVAAWLALLVSSARIKLKTDARFMLDVSLWTLGGVSVLICGGLVSGLLILAAGILLFRMGRGRDSASGATAHALLLSGLLLLAACEFLFIRDPYGQALQRMNTVFKFHFIAWVMIGLATPYLLRSALRLVRPPRLRMAYSGVALALLLAGSAYPILATNYRLREFAKSGWDNPDYDGLRFMMRDHPGDYEAIQWLNANVKPGAVILEATGPPYGLYSRFSVFSPARAVIGWANHESVWRGGDLNSIVSDVHRIYAGSDAAETRDLLKKNNVQFISVGWLERQDFAGEKLQKFESLFPVVFESADGGTVIYRVGDDPPPDR